VAAGSWSEASDPYAPGAAEDWLSVPGDHSRSAIALRVRGDSMEPRFPDGCIVIVEPHRKPVSGNFVVVRNNDWDEATFKQYVVDGGIKLLRPLNAQYPTLQIGPGTVLVGVVVRKIIDEAV
jgi:SOS-response transcriptional repressor LexA